MAHEDLQRVEVVDGSSDRSFGFVFAVVFLIIAMWPLLHGNGPRWWSLGIAAVFGVVAVARPVLLAPMNRMWTKLGVLLGMIVSPVALGVLYFLVFVPIGAVLRMSGKDPLRLKLDKEAASYWIDRAPPGPPPDSMGNQF